MFCYTTLIIEVVTILNVASMHNQIFDNNFVALRWEYHDKHLQIFLI